MLSSNLRPASAKIALLPSLKLGRFAFFSLLFFLLLLAFYVRFLFWIKNGGLEPNYVDWATENYFPGITRVYADLALEILAKIPFGNWTIIDARELPGSSFGSPLISYPPGYPLILAALRLVGIQSLQYMRVVQFVFDALALLPLTYVFRNLKIAPSIALLGCSFYAVAPWWANGSSFILAESILPALVIFSLALMIWCLKQNRFYAWFVLGIALSFLAWIRADMILLVIPLIILGYLSKKNFKQATFFALVGVVGFSILPISWGVFNLLARGDFAITSRVGWYAFSSGLGQFPNEAGYYLSDAQALDELSAQNITPHTAASEVFFRQKYFEALIDHPDLVIRNIFKRIGMILIESDYGSQFLLRLTWFYVFGPIVYIAATIIALSRKKFIDAFIISGPLIYAIFSLGITYLELRYIRYAPLTYLLAGCYLLQAIANFLASRIFSFKTPLGLSFISTAIAACLGTVLFFEAFKGINLLLKADRAAIAISLSETAKQVPLDLELKPAIKEASVVKDSSGQQTTLTTSFGTSGYQIYEPLTFPSEVSAVVLRGTIDVIEGGAFIGLLRGDGSRFLAFQTTVQHGPQQQFLSTLVEPGMIFVVANYRPAPQSSGQSRFKIYDLQASFFCKEDASGLLDKILIALDPRKITPCTASAIK